jgi:hypothetical protein
MKTIVTQEKNGITIIVGFSDPVIDPVETERHIKSITKDYEKLDKKNKLKLIKKQAIYFQPKNGEYIISDQEQDKLRKIKVPDNHKMRAINILKEKVDTELIPDYSDCSVWKYVNNNWEEIKLNIGEDLQSNTYLTKYLTEEQKNEIAEQKEVEQIRGLSKEERTIEVNKIIENLSYNAAIKRSAFEIQGESNALQLATEWYDEEVQKVNELYNLE